MEIAPGFSMSTELKTHSSNGKRITASSIIHLWLIFHRMTWDVQWARNNEKLHVSLTSFNKLAVYWFGKHFYFVFQCDFVQLLRNAKVVQLKSSFTCRSRHKAGSCDCHNSRRRSLDIRGDHRTCRNTGRIHIHDLPAIKKFLEHMVAVSMRHDKWSVGSYLCDWGKRFKTVPLCGSFYLFDV